MILFYFYFVLKLGHQRCFISKLNAFNFIRDIFIKSYFRIFCIATHTVQYKIYFHYTNVLNIIFPRNASLKMQFIRFIYYDLFDTIFGFSSVKLVGNILLHNCHVSISMFANLRVINVFSYLFTVLEFRIYIFFFQSLLLLSNFVSI